MGGRTEKFELEGSYKLFNEKDRNLPINIAVTASFAKLFEFLRTDFYSTGFGANIFHKINFGDYTQLTLLATIRGFEDRFTSGEFRFKSNYVEFGPLVNLKSKRVYFETGVISARRNTRFQLGAGYIFGGSKTT